MAYDLIIVGAGPAGIFTALELLRRGSKKKILILEKGQPVEKRHCPKAETGRCMNCKPYCHITTGFSGAGAFSDGKLSLSCQVGGDLPELIGEDLAQSLIRLRGRHLSGIRRRRTCGGDRPQRGDQGDPQAGHPGRLTAGGLPHPPPGHRESPATLSTPSSAICWKRGWSSALGCSAPI